MFRSLGGTLEKRKRQLIKTDTKSNNITDVFNQFLEENFREYKDFFKWGVEYNPNDGRVIIKTESKVIANEISLKMEQLARLFKERNIKVSKIIIL